MILRIGYDIVTKQRFPTPMVLMLNTRPDSVRRFIRPDDPRIDPEIPMHPYLDSFGNRCLRIVAPAGTMRISADALLENDAELDDYAPDARQHPVEELPDECLPFLLGSRYCEVDKLTPFAWETFGRSDLGWARVQAVSDWVHNHVKFGYEYASSTKTAADVLEEGRGVCRDFQHLAVTLCRCLGIPARYATGYLGEIRMAPLPGAMDFSAWYEAYLGDRWYSFDARFNERRRGRTLMAVGRDATDVALLTTFGPHELDKFEVICEEFLGDPGQSV